AIGFGIKAQKKKVTTGSKGLLNKEGTTITTLNPTGQVSVFGEIWNAESEEGFIDKKQKVVVTNVTDLLIKVRLLKNTNI
ncbi:NfeD family protein, partial [Bacteroidota bacterium]